jgi:hypothetical protein
VEVLSCALIFGFPTKLALFFFFLSDPSHALKNYSLLGMRREARERQSICILSLRLRCSFPYSFFFFFTLCLSRSLRTHGHTKKVSSLLDAQIFLYLIRTLEIRVSRLYALGNTRFLTSCQQRKLPIAEDVFWNLVAQRICQVFAWRHRWWSLIRTSTLSWVEIQNTCWDKCLNCLL